MPMTEILAEIERDFHHTATAWRDHFLEARRLRLAHRAVVAGLFEAANSADPELAGAYRRLAAHLSDGCREVDFAVRQLLAKDVAVVDFDNGTPQEMIKATADARARIADALEPVFEQRARDAAIVRAELQKRADAELALAEARQQLAAAEAKAREPSIDQARQALKAAEQQLAAMAKEPAR